MLAASFPVLYSVIFLRIFRFYLSLMEICFFSRLMIYCIYMLQAEKDGGLLPRFGFSGVQQQKTVHTEGL